MDTENVAKIMANAIGGKLVKIDGMNLEELLEYDFFSFNPGIYAFNQNKDMIGFLEEELQDGESIHIIHIPKIMNLQTSIFNKK